MKFVFAGTPPFAAAALAALLDAGHEAVLVLCQPDRPAGRGMKVQPGAVSALAQSRGIEVFQPLTLRRVARDGAVRPEGVQAQQRLASAFDAGARCMIVAAYGLILPQEVIDMPALGCINIHASLLPRWRGAAPIQRAIEAGDSRSGITLMRMDAGLDTGPMLLTAETPIDSTTSAARLHDTLASIGARLVVEAMPQLDQLVPVPQPDSGVTYAAKLDKAEARLDFGAAAAVVARKIMAFDPVPGATAELDGQSIKLWQAHVVQGRGSPGTVLAADRDDAIVIACGSDAVAVTELQRAGAKRLPARAFLAGMSIAPGAVFESSAGPVAPGFN
ncbi:methionyl-tRNA formyltransferase [soil metagenome]